MDGYAYAECYCWTCDHYFADVVQPMFLDLPKCPRCDTASCLLDLQRREMQVVELLEPATAG